ncbi:MAG: antibiotic biosynthesis monooxygenase family protein [Acidimicrobiia bacterium]
MIVRMFLSTMTPEDVEEVVRLFEDARAVFAAQPECLGIELILSPEQNVAGNIEGGAISRWTSLEGMEEAFERTEVQESRARILKLLRREPVVKIYEVRT